MFDYFISLGSACPVAASMQKYGLRSFSGPYDWLITPDFKGVLHYLETDFGDFLLQENLEKYRHQNQEGFLDKKTGIKFIHETYNFEREYNKLKEKYDRRISRFLKASKSKVCYLRSIRNQEDVEYIKNNSDYIRDVIKKNNPDSELVLLYGNDCVVYDKLPFYCYNTPGIWSGASWITLRSYFDHADDFLEFCASNYSSSNLMKNVVYDRMKSDLAEYRGVVYERRYATLTKLLCTDFHNKKFWGGESKIVIYGAGVIGCELYRKIRTFAHVVCFLDRDKAGTEFQGLKIMLPEEIQPNDNVKVIITVTYDFENIKNELLAFFHDENICSLDEILN